MKQFAKKKGQRVRRHKDNRSVGMMSESSKGPSNNLFRLFFIIWKAPKIANFLPSEHKS